jgi:ribosomal protein S18 acetylase RimI-like enzyme
MPITIRFADASDAALIAQISQQTFYETFAVFNSKENMDKFMTEQFSIEKLMAEVGAPNNIFLLAMENDEVLGYARLRENNKPPELGNANTIEIARIYAVTSSIGKGVGKVLMQKSLDVAAGLKKDTIWLGVWEQNQRAIDFYIKWGFEKFSTHVFMLGDDAQTDWLMKKSV